MPDETSSARPAIPLPSRGLRQRWGGKNACRCHTRCHILARRGRRSRLEWSRRVPHVGSERVSTHNHRGRSAWLLEHRPLRMDGRHGARSLPLPAGLGRTLPWQPDELRPHQPTTALRPGPAPLATNRHLGPGHAVADRLDAAGCHRRTTTLSALHPPIGTKQATVSGTAGASTGEVSNHRNGIVQRDRVRARPHVVVTSGPDSPMNSETRSLNPRSIARYSPASRCRRSSVQCRPT